jgi:cyclase
VCSSDLQGLASAVLAASIFHYGEISIKEAKEFLNKKNIPIRLS